MVQHNHQYRRNIPPPPPRLPPRPPPRASPTQQLTSSPSQAEKGIYRRQIGSEPSRRIKVLYALLAILFLLAQLQSVDLRDCFKPAIISESPRIEASDYHRFAINASAYLHLSDVKSIILSDPISRMPNESSWLLEKDAIGFSETERSIRIPRTINKIYFQRDGKFDKKGMRDERLKRAHDTWPELNPGYEVRYFNLLHARRYLRQHFHPVFLRTFDCVQAFAGKVIFFEWHCFTERADSTAIGRKLAYSRLYWMLYQTRPTSSRRLILVTHTLQHLDHVHRMLLLGQCRVIKYLPNIWSLP